MLMKFAINLSFGLLMGMLSFCGRQSGNDISPMVQSSEKLKLTLVDTLIIPVDSMTQPSYYYDQFKVIDSIPYYFIYNGARGSLQAYDLSFNKKDFSIEFEKEGANGIDFPFWFDYHNQDSIFFIYSNDHTRISLYNSLGKRVSSWVLTFPDDYKNSWISNELFYRPDYDPGTNTLGFWISRGYVDRLAFQKTLKQCRFNIKTQEYIFFGDTPKEFETINFYPNNYINGYATGDSFVTYFNTAHEIHIYRKDSLSKVKKIFAKSNFLPARFEPLKKKDSDDPDIQEESNYNATHGFYAKMVSNENFTYHYRIVKHPADLRYSDGKRRNFYDRKFSVMVMDKNFNLIEEVEFSGGKFDFFQSFAYGNKLLLSLNNAMNDFSSDDQMQFAVYEVK